MTATELAEPVVAAQEPHLQREPLQLLAPDGTYSPSSGLTHGLDDDELQELYARMVVTRKVDREIINLQRQGQVGVYPSCLGQEAAQVGAAAALGPRDWVFPQYRELGFALQLGVTPTALAHLWRGTWHLGYDPFEHRYAPISIPIGTQALHAVGYAMGAKLDGVELATVACFGDGATSTGDVHEAMNFAGVYQAPVVFFVQNNRYAISVPLAKQTAAPTLAHKAIGYGMPALRCDGNDVLASYVTTKRALELARSGGGPVFVEALTYRMEAHTTSDDPSLYRTDEEVEEARREDPLARMRTFLEGRGLLYAAFESGVEERATAETTRLREDIYDAPHGDPLELFEHVYVDPTGHFEDQRRQLQTELEASEAVKR